MKSERISWIDVARGIGIILVIYGHAMGATTIRFLIYSFHMPLFFFLSGLVFKGGKNKPYLSFLKKDFIRIMIPYFIYALFFFLFWVSKLPQDEVTIGNLSHQVFGIFYANGNKYLSFYVILWFLPCLFLTKQIFWFISKLPTKSIALTLLFFSIIGYSFSVFFPDFKLPYGFEIILTSIVFFGLGYLWNFIPEKLIQKLKKFAIPLLLACIFITIFFAFINFNLYDHQIDMRLNRLNNYFLFYISAICGILATLLLSIIINKNKILQYLGANTMPLFVWHSFIFIYITEALLIFLTPKSLSLFRNSFISPIFYTAFSILVILTSQILYKKINKTIAKHNKK